MKHLDIRITGRVQGVNFRGATRSRAMELGAKGFVRNEPDGAVYLEAEGDAETLDALVRWLHHGPPPARVDSVETGESEFKNFTSFTIEG